jgi:phospholipid/cholesterol/gamma-HCH transport system substrate-binding protein
LLVDDLGKLATVSDTYAEVTPEVATVLRNSVTTGNTFVEKEAKVQALFQDVAGFSSTSKDFLEQNGSNIIRLSKQGQAQLPLFAKYAPEYPCLVKGIVGLIPLQSQAFRNYTLHINLEVLPRQPRGYNPGDRPAYDEHGQNAVPLGQCNAAIHRTYSQRNLPPKSLVPDIDDGVNYPVGKQRPATGFDLSSGYAGSTSESRVVASLAAPELGVPAQRVPDVAGLLFGPLARGAEVSLR